MIQKSLAVIAAFLTIYGVSAQDKNSKFLEKNKEVVTASDMASPLFDAAFYQNDYFLFGELHGSAEPQQIDLALLKLLHEKAGVRHYIAEVDHTKAWLLNRFLANGNTELLDQVFRSWKADTAQWANRQYYEKFRELYNWQQSLPADQRITVVGIDEPHDYSLVEEHIREISQQLVMPLGEQQLDTLYSLIHGEPNKKSLAHFGKWFLELIEHNEAAFKESLGSDYPSFRHLMASFSFLDQSRDQVMYANFADQLSGFGWENAKMYGFLGFYHCLQTSFNGSEPFAALVRKNFPAGKKIATLQMFVLDSECMMPLIAPMRRIIPPASVKKLAASNPEVARSGKYIATPLSYDSGMMSVSGIASLSNASAAGTITLFRLTGKKSPYLHTTELTTVTGMQQLSMTDPTAVTVDAFQYILLFRNCKAAVPLE